MKGNSKHRQKENESYHMYDSNTWCKSTPMSLAPKGLHDVRNNMRSIKEVKRT